MTESIQKIASEIADQNAEVVVYKINYYPADYTLQVLHEKWKNKEILTPQFQRGFVWNVVQASRLIESFLLGLPVPGVFFNRERDTQKLLVIDGRQRLESVFSYFDNRWPDSNKQFCLKGVDAKWLNRSFEDLDESDKIRLKDSVLRAIIVEQIDPKDNTSILYIFERLNTGGTTLTPQEVRNCVYHGVFNDLLNNLNENAEWRNIIGLRIKDKRMRDVEFILRFFALSFEHKNYKKPMKKFLTDFMVKHRNKRKQLEEFRVIFERTVSTIHQHLGKNCFRVKAGLNVAVLDSVMVSFALNIDRVPSNAKVRYKKLIEIPEFIDSVSLHTTDEDRVLNRIKLAMETLF